MENTDRVYIAIDLKSFYASVECVDRGLDPLDTNLVVADVSRTEKTICLAVTPSLKAYGISGRARLFEAVQAVRNINTERRKNNHYRKFSGSSVSDKELKAAPSLELDFIKAVPRMSRYMQVSTNIYNIYLRYIAPEDIYVYSVDEVFIDATAYLDTYKLTAHEFTVKLIHEVLDETGITATAGIGTNLYLCKVAMDIVAKHMPADKDGVRIAELDEYSYRRRLWAHKPITDFWRVGKGTARKLEQYGMYTMGDVARCSMGEKYERRNEDLLYKLFGKNAEYLIDHAWGWEPCTMKAIKSYRPRNTSISSGQVLHCPYEYEGGKLIAREMTELLVLDLVEKGMLSSQAVLTVGYDIENLSDKGRTINFTGSTVIDHYGRRVPESAHGSVNFGSFTSSSKIITDSVAGLFERITDHSMLIRRITIALTHLIPEDQRPEQEEIQLSFFADNEAVIQKKEKEQHRLAREKKLQLTMIELKKKFGRNAVLKGMNLEEGATSIQRNEQVGGHKA